MEEKKKKKNSAQVSVRKMMK